MARHRRHSARTTAIVSDVVVTANSASWRIALLLGVTCWLTFALALPAWINHLYATLDGNPFQSIVEPFFARRTHWLTRIGNACLLVGVFFAIKNYLWPQPIGGDGRRLIVFFARLLGRNTD